MVTALDLPNAAQVNRRVPKKLLLEHGAPTAADKRLLNDGIERVQWVATLKPTTVGIAAFRDEAREYLEIAILGVMLREGTNSPRLVELVHRAVPYPVLAISGSGSWVQISLAHKRWSQGEIGKTVLDGSVVTVDCPDSGDPYQGPFLAALKVDSQPRNSLLSLYQGWMDVVLALQAARRTGRFELYEAGDRLAARRDALLECARLEVEVVRLRASAAKEKQMSRRVELNLALKRVEAAQTAARANL